MNIDQVRYRYENDASFNQLVKTLYQAIHNMHFTHEELRDAAFLAALQIEEQCLPALYALRLQEEDIKEQRIPIKSGWNEENIDGKY